LRNALKSCDVVLIDDIDVLKSNQMLQLQCAHLIRALQRQRVQIVMTSRCWPQAISVLHRNMKTSILSYIAIEL
jgi:chromosomal replication initiation ATPase DnaA